MPTVALAFMKYWLKAGAVTATHDAVLEGDQGRLYCRTLAPLLSRYGVSALLLCKRGCWLL